MNLRDLTLALALGGLVSCSSGGDSGDSDVMEGRGALDIVVTDSPLMHDIVVEAAVRVDQVRVHATDSAVSGWTTVYEGPQLSYDLMELQNGVTRTLVSLADLPAGRYDKIRLRVAEASIELTNGSVYSTVAGNLNPTSTVTSGLQIQIDPPLELVGGASETLVLDFDLGKTFHAVPANDPLNATTFQLHKGVRAANLSTTGEVRGTVRLASDGSLVEDATVWVLPPGEMDLEDAVASASSDENGSWAVIGLPPGPYDLQAGFGLLGDRAEDVEVNVGSATPVDLELE